MTEKKALKESTYMTFGTPTMIGVILPLLKKKVIVNWFGTLIVDKPIQALEGPDRPYKEIVDWSYDDEY